MLPVGLSNGRMAIKASYGRYTGATSGSSPHPGPSASAVNPNVAITKTYNNWDGSIPYVPVPANLGSTSGGGGTQVLDSNLKALTTDEYTAGLEFGGRGYVPFETTDLASGQWTVPAEYQLPASPRHGTVIPLTRDEYERLAEHWPAAARGNPVLPGYHADPNIAVFGDTYYLYPTTDGHPDWSGTTFSVWSSRDLVHWRDHGVALDLGPGVSWADARAWAPAIAERDGRYYFYFCAEAMIGVATGDSPTGPFTDTGAPLIEANPDGSGQAIDPAVFTDRDGQSYLYWGNGVLHGVRLADDLHALETSLTGRR